MKVVNDVLFIDTSTKGYYQAGKIQNVLIDKHLDKIIAVQSEISTHDPKPRKKRTNN